MNPDPEAGSTIISCDIEQNNLSRRAAKKAKRKQLKALKKREALAAYLLDNTDASNSNNITNNHNDIIPSSSTTITSSSSSSSSPYVGGKASRARACIAQQNNGNFIAKFLPPTSSNSQDVHEFEQHRPQGGEPILSKILPQHLEAVQYLEAKEQEMRIARRGMQMRDRMIVEVDCHGSMETRRKQTCGEGHNQHNNEEGCVDLSNSRAKGIVSDVSWSSIDSLPSLSSILRLDLSRNELWDISTDALQPLASTLHTLDISRNWFETLPESIGTLKNLRVLRASHNLLKPNATMALRLDTLKNIKQLEVLDIRFNQKCGNRSLLELLQSTLGDKVDVNLTVTYPPPDTSNDDRVGASPAVRDARLLRSQLEPWSTMALRRRLVADFGEKYTVNGHTWADSDVSRGEVMNRLLAMYQEEAASVNNDSQACNKVNNGRAIVHVSGVEVEKSICERVLKAMKELWDTTPTRNRERPSIFAENYMILCNPSMFDPSSSQKAAKAAGKLKRHQAIWNLAFEAMNSVDPIFASQYTAVALTDNFHGSPHIDKQNCGPFYGFSVGNFEEGTGQIMVECSARVLAAVNTKNRFAKVDGRFPHWVAPYDGCVLDRYSLIYYRTKGDIDSIGPAIFDVPA